jgi:hypothetical protein
LIKLSCWFKLNQGIKHLLLAYNKVGNIKEKQNLLHCFKSAQKGKPARRPTRVCACLGTRPTRPGPGNLISTSVVPQSSQTKTAHDLFSCSNTPRAPGLIVGLDRKRCAYLGRATVQSILTVQSDRTVARQFRADKTCCAHRSWNPSHFLLLAFSSQRCNEGFEEIGWVMREVQQSDGDTAGPFIGACAHRWVDPSPPSGTSVALHSGP